MKARRLDDQKKINTGLQRAMEKSSKLIVNTSTDQKILKLMFSFFTVEVLKMVSEKEAEALAKKACEDYITNCNLQTTDEAKLASQKMLALANELFKTMHDQKMDMDTVQ